MEIPRLDLTRFPARNRGSLPRPVYFLRLHPEDRLLLEGRGYLPKLLMDLPRGTPASEEAYLLAKAQALEEDTGPRLGKNEIAIVELQMKANRMLEKGANVRVNVKMGSQDVMSLMQSWGNSRHTLRGNTTIQEAQAPLKEAPKALKKKGRVKK